MCEPTTFTAVTMGVIATASAVANVYGQEQQASAQKKYQSAQAEAQAQMAEQNQKSAVDAMHSETYQQGLALQQEREAGSQETQDAQTESLQKMGTEVASSSAVPNALMQDFMRSEANYRDAIKYNMDVSALQTRQQGEMSRAKAQDRINSVSPYIPEPIQQPNYIGAGLQIAGGATNAYSYYQSTALPDDSRFFAKHPNIKSLRPGDRIGG